MVEEKHICENCGSEYSEHEHNENVEKKLDARDKVLKLCPDCMFRAEIG